MKKEPIGFYPTPLHLLKNISAEFTDHQLFIKRDDLTGLATGGNKVRKLEYLLADAMAKNKQTIVTVGSQQSNHCRQTAAACRMFGLNCHLLLNGYEPATYDGNLLLSKILGATIHFTRNQSRQEATKELLASMKKESPYFIPVGGSNLTGSFGYVDAMKEVQEQLHKQQISIDYMIVATGSGGTHAGMVIGKEIHQLSAEILAIRIDKQVGEQTIEEHTLEIVQKGLAKYELNKRYGFSDLHVVGGYDEAGYATITANETTAIRRLSLSDGILLDPVYTARAFYGMLHLLRKNQFPPGSNLLFWHTGGLPANFYYKDELQ